LVILTYICVLTLNGALEFSSLDWGKTRQTSG